MQSANINIRLIFVNYDGKPVEISVPELKKHVISEKWPENYIDKSQVEKLRLFSSGRELDDIRNVSDLLSLASTAGFAAVHVTVVNKLLKLQVNEESQRDSSDSSAVKCNCCVM